MNQELKDELTRQYERTVSKQEKFESWSEDATRTAATFEPGSELYKAALQKELDMLDRKRADFIRNFERMAIGQIEERRNIICRNECDLERIKGHQKKLKEALESNDVKKAEAVLKEGEGVNESILDSETCLPDRAFQTVEEVVVIPHSGKIVLPSFFTVKSSSKNIYFKNFVSLIDRFCSIKQNEEGIYAFTLADRGFTFNHVKNDPECEHGMMIITSPNGQTITMDQVTEDSYEVEERYYGYATKFYSERDALDYIFMILPDQI